MHVEPQAAAPEAVATPTADSTMSESHIFSDPVPITTDADEAQAAAAPEGEEDRVALTSVSFIGLLLTQFLVAWNDNMFRWLIVPVGQRIAGEGSEATILAAGLACFVLPYVLLAAPAGWLADRFSKRNVIVGCKFAEIVIMALGLGTILWGNLYAMFAVVALMGAQSALFSPAKLGAIPELVRSDRISAANGVFGLTTVVAIVGGTVAGGWLFTQTTIEGMGPGRYRWWISAAALLGVASVGWIASLLIRRLRPANPGQPFPLDAPVHTGRDLANLFSHKPLFLAALGSAFFWWLGSLAQVNIDLFGKKVLYIEQDQISILLGLMTLGVGVGSVLAGFLSRGRIELGMVPFGAAIIAGAAVLLSTISGGTENNPAMGGFYLSCVWLVTMGIGGGIFEIPLQAFLQHRSPEKTRGSIMAAYNFMVFGGMLAVAGLFYLLGTVFRLSPKYIFLIAGVVTLPIGVIIVRKLAYDTTRFVAETLKSLMYRMRIEGHENIPDKSGALLVSNHVSWADGILIGLALRRKVRMVVYADYTRMWWLRWFWSVANPIPIQPGRRSVVHSIREARRALENGELVCIFPEGGLTRDGTMQDFQPGFLSLLKGNDAPVIPVFLGGMWGSIFSYEGGRFFWKLPRKWPYPMSVRFGRPIEKPASIEQVRQAVVELGDEEYRTAKPEDAG